MKQPGEGTKAATKRRIAELYRAKVRATGPEKVRVADLVEELGINRNTFYYHFANKYEVALYVFRSDLDAKLRAALPNAELIASTGDNDSCDGLAFYSHKENGARGLDQGPFVSAVLECVAEDRALYQALFSLREPEFVVALRTLWQNAIEDDILFMLGGRYMPVEIREMLAYTSACSLISLIQFSLHDSSRSAVLADSAANPFHNYLAESLYAGIQAHPLTPPREKNRTLTGSVTANRC